MTLRIAVVTPIPTPYRDPFWQCLGAREDTALRVLFCAQGKADRPWEAGWGESLDARVMPGRNLLRWRGPDASCYWNPSCVRELESFAPKLVVVLGYNHPTMLSAMRWANRRCVPFVLACETWRLKGGSAKAWFRNDFVRRVLRRAAGVLTTGTRARRFIAHHTGGGKPCADLPNVPDIESITASAPEDRLSPTVARVVFAGRFIAKKRVHDLINAFGGLPSETLKHSQLTLIGDGKQRADLERQVDQLRLRNRIEFRGFLQPNEVLEAYRTAQIFVMPSSETWGVAPIEAAAIGLRVIVSDEVGCADDLERFVPVFRFPFGDVTALRDALDVQLRAALSGDRLPATDWQAWTHDSLAEKVSEFLRTLAK